jgi:hypothetical protein
VSKTPNSKWHSLGDFLAAKEAKKQIEEDVAPTSPVAPTLDVAPAPPVAPTNSSQLLLQKIGATPDVAPTPDVEAHQFTRVVNGLFDKILPTLKPQEQVVLLRLYRLSRGFNSDRCMVSVGKLATTCNIGTTSARLALQVLESRGYIKRLRTDQSNPNQQNRGIEFEMVLPAAAPTARVGAARGVGATSGVGATPDVAIKESIKTKIIKGESAPPDYKNCPDCQGSGFWYPEGNEKGVAKCKHERLTQEK